MARCICGHVRHLGLDCDRCPCDASTATQGREAFTDEADTLAAITPAAFGLAMAKAIKKNPDSRYWRLVELALEETGIDLLEVHSIRPLIDRLANLERGT